MNVLSAALPEFLGSLASGLVLGMAGRLIRRRRYENPPQPNPEHNDTPSDW